MTSSERTDDALGADDPVEPPPAPLLPADGTDDTAELEDENPWGEPAPKWIQRVVLGMSIAALVAAFVVILAIGVKN